LQQILKERCQFAAHAEEKEVPVFALTISKSGLKMKQTPTGGVSPKGKVQEEELDSWRAVGERRAEASGQRVQGETSTGSPCRIFRAK